MLIARTLQRTVAAALVAARDCKPMILPLMVVVALVSWGGCEDDGDNGRDAEADTDRPDATDAGDPADGADDVTPDSAPFDATTDATLVAETTDDALVDETTEDTLADTLPDATSCAGAQPGGLCTNEGQSCSIGEECCCGECAPSLVCDCYSGTWSCYYTDFCLRPGCDDPDVVDAQDAVDAAEVADGSSAACEDAEKVLSATLYDKPASAYTAVVRLDHDTRALLGYALVLGRYAATDEAGARATAQAETGYGAAGRLLSGPEPEDAWVFYQSPGDFGGVGVVSARTSLAVFGGGIVWDGRGDISYPTAWSPATDLASGCTTTGDSGRTRGFDLVSGEALDSGDVDAALAVVRQTALVDAMWSGGYVFDSVVLRYPRSVGVFDPTSAEWIVLVSGGWLE